MVREVKLSEMQSVLAALEYPASQTTAAAQFQDVVVELADGSVNLGAVIERVSESEFESVLSLQESVYSWLPRRAVGEPYQSEGSA